jgi:broad specificity phosphatase PhoE
MGPVTILIRHADIALPPAESDPPLNAIGLSRAEKLSHVLGDVGLGAIYVTGARRTQQTARPIAEKAQVPPQVIDSVDMVVAALLGLPASSTALVVGHANTVPEIITRLGGLQIAPIGPTEFDNLYLLVSGQLTHLRYTA